MTADFGMETISKVEREGAVGKVDYVAFRGVDKDFVGEEIQLQFVQIDFFAFAETGGGGLELGNPEKVCWEMLDLSFFIVFGQFLLVIIETCGETTFGVFVHFASADLEFDNFFVRSDDGCVERLVTILLWNGDIVFYAAGERSVEGMDYAENEIAGRDVVDDNTEGGKIINFADVLVVFREFFMERIDGFDAAGKLEIYFFFFQKFGDFSFDFSERFFAGLVGSFD